MTDLARHHTIRPGGEGSVPRTPDIIHRPELAPPVRRGVLALIAALGWALWFYLIAPLSALLAWLFGYERLQTHLLDDPAKTLHTLQIYALVISLAGVIFISWAIYNWVRFRHKDRRRAPSTIDSRQLAEDMDLEHGMVLMAREAKILTFAFDDEGRIQAIIGAAEENARPPSESRRPPEKRIEEPPLPV